MLKRIEEDLVRLLKENAYSKEELERKEKLHHDEMKKVLLEILEVLDDFNRKFINIDPKIQNADSQTKIWINNFRSVKKHMERVINEFGIVEIESIGFKALPQYHFVLETKPNDRYEDETIIEEVSKGYLWKKEVLRKAQVVTVRN